MLLAGNSWWIFCRDITERIPALSEEERISDVPEGSSDFTGEVFRAAETEVGPVPFERSYWVLPGRLLAGAYPGNPYESRAEEKLRSFLEAGIRCFVDLTSPEDENLYGQALVSYRSLIDRVAAGSYKIEYHRMSILDMDVPSNALMREILDTIDGSVSRGLPAYVHCLGGFGRTGTVVGCWLVRHGIERGKGVLQLIRKLRRNDPQSDWESPQTAGQRRFVLEWKPGE